MNEYVSGGCSVTTALTLPASARLAGSRPMYTSNATAHGVRLHTRVEEVDMFVPFVAGASGCTNSGRSGWNGV